MQEGATAFQQAGLAKIPGDCAVAVGTFAARAMTFDRRSAPLQKAAVPAAQVAIQRALPAAAAEQAPARADDVVDEIAGNLWGLRFLPPPWMRKEEV